ncbi:unnamed protein product [Urochloa humidicola]
MEKVAAAGAVPAARGPVAAPLLPAAGARFHRRSGREGEGHRKELLRASTHPQLLVDDHRAKVGKVEYSGFKDKIVVSSAAGVTRF